MEIKSGGITTSLIVKFSGEKDLKKITRLDFYSKSLKIKRIENLEECENLQELRLSYNYISKIENLSSLSSLKHLDLSENSIKRLENLNSLKNLEHLNLSGNLIKEIDKEGLAGLINLIFFNISKNKIARISEFGNLEVLPSLEHIITSGNQVKQADLKDYLPAKIQSLKLIDGEPVSHNPSVNASLWVYKENFKDLKSQLSQKSKEINSMIEELNVVQGQIHDIEKSAPDKKYMKDLLDRAEVLNTSSVELQQNMASNRENLAGLNKKLEKFRKNESSGNFIVDEINLLDQIKHVKDNIEEFESQYGVIIEELEKIALEISRMDALINSTPKFKSNEVKNLEIKAQELNEMIGKGQEEVTKIKQKIEECSNLIGTGIEGRVIDSALDKVWSSLTEQVWIEETDDPASEYKRWAGKVCEIIDKERNDFLKISSKQNEEIKKLEGRLQSLNNKFSQENSNFVLNKELGLQVEEMKGEIDNLREIIVKKNKEIKNLNDSSRESSRNKETSFLFNSPTNETQNLFKQFLDFIEKLKIPKNPENLFSTLESYKSLFDQYHEKCSKFKEKKQKLVSSFQAKNLEISEKIQKLNQNLQDLQKDKQELQKEKQELQKEKSSILQLRQKSHQKLLEIQEYESKIDFLNEERASLESCIIKLEYKLQNLKEEYEVYNERKYKIFQDLSRMQDLIDNEGDKLQETRIKLHESSGVLQKHQEILQEVEKNKDITCSQSQKISEDIKNRENQLYYLEHKIQEAQNQLRSEIELKTQLVAQREEEIREVLREIERKQAVLNGINAEVDRNMEKFNLWNEKIKGIEGEFDERNDKRLKLEARLRDLESIAEKTRICVRNDEERLIIIEKEIRIKEEELLKIKKILEGERSRMESFEDRNRNLEICFENTRKMIQAKEDELERVTFLLNEKYNELGGIRRNEKVAGSIVESGAKRHYCETDRVYTMGADSISQADYSKSSHLQEASKISSSSFQKDSEMFEKYRKPFHTDPSENAFSSYNTYRS